MRSLKDGSCAAATGCGPLLIPAKFNNGLRGSCCEASTRSLQAGRCGTPVRTLQTGTSLEFGWTILLEILATLVVMFHMSCAAICELYLLVEAPDREGYPELVAG